jgi:hypothetical protein
MSFFRFDVFIGSQFFFGCYLVFTNEERKSARRLRESVPPAQAGGGFQRHQPMPGTGPGPARCLHLHSHNCGFVLPRRTSGEPVSPRNFFKLRLALSASANPSFVLVNSDVLLLFSRPGPNIIVIYK